jgi:thermostable 8-oxoguanine DNA glycosylase
VRNHLGSDAVAIIDIHIQRAGVIAGVFDRRWQPGRDYDLMETLFLAWAAEGGVNAGDLDAVIWSDMSSLGRSAARALGAPTTAASWYADET